VKDTTIESFATATTYPPDVACAEYFREAEQVARGSLLGLWGPKLVLSLTPIA